MSFLLRSLKTTNLSEYLLPFLGTALCINLAHFMMPQMMHDCFLTLLAHVNLFFSGQPT